MKRLSIFSLLSFLVLFLFVRCEQEVFLAQDLEDRIKGTWIFSEVKFRPSGNAVAADFTSGFEGSSITFHDNGVLTAYDKDLDTTASGWYMIDSYIQYDEDDDTQSTVYYMWGNFSIPELNVNVDFEWDELTVSKKKLRAIENKNDGEYTYKMTR